MKLYVLFLVSLLCACSRPHPPKTGATSKIQVLNVGTFHFGYTPDAHRTDYDEASAEAQAEVREVAALLAAFKPTIICLEVLPTQHEALNQAYQDFLSNYDTLDRRYGESSMLGFEVGRLSQTPKVYGIDNRMGYNYSVGDFFARSPTHTNAIDSTTYAQLTQEPFKEYPELARRKRAYPTLSLLEKLRLINHPQYLDYSINTNADKLLYVGSEEGFEGADNAAIFYHRNMKIYSNLNRIPMTSKDRVFILMGSAHTAFLREFIQRSPKFRMVSTANYLK